MKAETQTIEAGAIKAYEAAVDQGRSLAEHYAATGDAQVLYLQWRALMFESHARWIAINSDPQGCTVSIPQGRVDGFVGFLVQKAMARA